jgi:hypothetical protein
MSDSFPEEFVKLQACEQVQQKSMMWLPAAR